MWPAWPWLWWASAHTPRSRWSACSSSPSPSRSIDGHWIALIQTKVGFDLQGRVLSIFITVMMLTMPLGYLVVGPVADRWVQPLLEPGGALVGNVGAVIGTGPGRGWPCW